jgi:hypothetical protein
MENRRVVLPSVVHEVNRPFERKTNKKISGVADGVSRPNASKVSGVRQATKTKTKTTHEISGVGSRKSKGVQRRNVPRTNNEEHLEQPNIYPQNPVISPLKQSLAKPPSRNPHAWHDSDMFTLRPEDESTTFQHINHQKLTENSGRYIRPGRTLKYFASGKNSSFKTNGVKKSSTAAADDWDAGKQILKSLRTGEDAISFFAKEGARSAVKFIYLVKAETGAEFRPYDLSVVPGNQFQSSGSSNSTHFVMTEKGLTKMTRNPETGAVVPSEGK